MKLLFDQNLSRKLPKKIAEIFPGSTHVWLEGLETATDIQMRESATKNYFTIVTRDSRSGCVVRFVAKTIWLNRENASTSTFEQLLRSAHEQISASFLIKKEA